MLLCTKRDCSCRHHLMLYYLSQGKNDDVKRSLQEIENFNELADNSGKTLVRYAVNHWNRELLEYFIEKGCNVNAQDTCGVSPLMMAIERNKEIVDILLQNGADVYVTNCHGKSVFELAMYSTLGVSRTCSASSASSSICILQMIVDKVNDDFSKGKLDQWLLNARDLVKLILLTFGSAELISFVLKNGYPIDYKDKFTHGCTALHCAMAMARLKNVKILMEHGANVDALDEEGCTPLYYYSPNFDDFDESSELLICLLTSSTKICPIDKCSFKSIERLLTRGKKNTVSWVVLLSGIDAKTYLANGITLLSCLIRNSNEGIIDILDELNIKFDPNERTSNGYTILAEAVRNGCPKKVEFLLRHGADVNIISPKGQSTLMYVNTCPMTSYWRTDATKIVELMLQYGSRDAQSLLRYRKNLSDKFCLATSVIVAHLALLEAQDSSSITSESWKIIKSNAQSKIHFDVCTKQLEEMKDIELHGTVTFFKLLTESDEKMVIYARNQDLLSSFCSVMKNFSHFEPYYLNYAQIRLSRGVELAKLQEKVAIIIEALTGISADVYYAIIYRIIGYLERQDMKNLCDIQNHPPLK